MNATPSLAISDHPSLRFQRRWLIVCLAFTSCIGVLECLQAEWFAASLSLGASAWIAWGLRALPRRLRAVQLHNLALRELVAGHDQRALELLAAVPIVTLRRGAIAIGVLNQRTAIALHRGETERAIELATAAIGLPLGRLPLARAHENMHLTKAIALRAFARAAAGQDAGALIDARVAETSIHATPDVLSRATLARAVILAREGDRAALASELSRTASMLQWLTPRERALTRALRRMARAPAKSVYREPARPDDVSEEAKLASWIGTVAPGAEAFARDTAAVADTGDLPLSVESPSGTALARAAQAREGLAKSGRRRVRSRTLLVWLGLMVVFVAMFGLLSQGAAEPTTPADSQPGASFGSPIVVVILAFVFAALLLWWRQFRMRRLSAAQLDIARGEVAKARPVLEATAQSWVGGFAAMARLGLAQLAERTAAWSEVLEHVNQGVARLNTPTLRAVHSDSLLPELLETRALALAASDRAEDANAERALLAKEFPGYVFLHRAELRVRLMTAVRAGDLDLAARVARTRSPDAPLSIREDMLADVALAAATAVSPDEQERIEAELRDDGELLAWIDAVAPGARSRRRARIAAEPAEVDWVERIEEIEDVAEVRPKERPPAATGHRGASRRHGS